MSMSDSNYSADERLQGSEFSEMLVHNRKSSSKWGFMARTRVRAVIPNKRFNIPLTALNFARAKFILIPLKYSVWLNSKEEKLKAKLVSLAW